QGQVTSGANSIAQRAVITAVLAEPNALDYMVKEFHKRRDLVIGLLQDIPNVKTTIPEGAFYAFPDISWYFGKTLKGRKINNSEDLATYLLAEANVATVTGSAFGDANCIRLSYATSEDMLIEALRSIKEALV